MIIPCDEKNIKLIFDYIGEDYGKCLYIYIDLKKFGLNDENFNVWIQYDDNEDICGIISEYYGGIQLYSKHYNLICKEIADFILQKDPKVIFSIKENIDKIKEYLPDYSQETGYVGELMEIKYPVENNAYSAPIDELEEIVSIIAEDENIGKPYGFESIYQQYLERKQKNFGRNFILRDEENNEIIGHAGTYAELPELAVLGGVITSIPYRGKGFSKKVISPLLQDLKSENKRVFSYYYITSAKRLHNSVGFEEIGEWSKLLKND